MTRRTGCPCETCSSSGRSFPKLFAASARKIGGSAGQSRCNSCWGPAAISTAPPRDKCGMTSSGPSNPTSAPSTSFWTSSPSFRPTCGPFVLWLPSATRRPWARIQRRNESCIATRTRGLLPASQKPLIIPLSDIARPFLLAPIWTSSWLNRLQKVSWNIIFSLLFIFKLLQFWDWVCPIVGWVAKPEYANSWVLQTPTILLLYNNYYWLSIADDTVFQPKVTILYLDL